MKSMFPFKHQLVIVLISCISVYSLKGSYFKYCVTCRYLVVQACNVLALLNICADQLSANHQV